jgi:hypothetical protein
MVASAVPREDWARAVEARASATTAVRATRRLFMLVSLLIEGSGAREYTPRVTAYS